MAQEAQKEKSMVLQKEMVEGLFDALSKVSETGKKVCYTFVPGNLSELIRTFDMLPVYPEINALQSAMRKKSASYIKEAEKHAHSEDVCNKRAEAAEVLETQILVSPSNALLKFRLALVLYQLDQVERAASICQQLVQWFPQFAEAYAFLAHLQLDMERPKDAEKTLSSAPRENRTARFWLTFARVAQALDDIDVAHSYINTAILLDYDYAEAYLVRAGLFQQQQKYAAALEDMTSIENRGYLSFQLISMKVNLLNDPSNIDVGTLRALLRPDAAEHMIAYKVCRAVNSSRGDSSTCRGANMKQRSRGGTDAEGISTRTL